MTEKREGQVLTAPKLFKSEQEKKQALGNLTDGVKAKLPGVRIKRVEDGIEFILDSGEQNQLYRAEKVIVWSGLVEYALGHEPLRVGKFYVEYSSEQEAGNGLFEAVKEVASQVS